MMKIMGRPFSRRGVSVIIAALLLIAIAVAAAVLLYVFSIGLLGSLQGSGGQQTKQQLIMEAYNWLGTYPVLSMRNVGTAGVTVADVFVNGIAATAGGCAPVAVQASCTIAVTGFGAGTGTITVGVAYTIKVVTADGGVFSYSAIAGQAS